MYKYATFLRLLGFFVVLISKFNSNEILNFALQVLFASLFIVFDIYSVKIKDKRYTFISIFPLGIKEFTIENVENNKIRYYFVFTSFFMESFHSYIDTDMDGNVLYQRTNFDLKTFKPRFNFFFHSYLSNNLRVL